MQQSANNYFEARQPNDLDLIAMVREELRQAGLELLIQANYDNHPRLINAKQRRPEVQRYELNRYWQLQLLATDAHSVEERFHLIPNGTVEEWFRLFKHKIVPFAVKHQLPRSII